MPIYRKIKIWEINAKNKKYLEITGIENKENYSGLVKATKKKIKNIKAEINKLNIELSKVPNTLSVKIEPYEFSGGTGVLLTQLKSIETYSINKLLQASGACFDSKKKFVWKK